MSKRTPPANVTFTELPAEKQPSTATGHAGHTLKVNADYGVFCETEGVNVSEDKVSGKRPGI